MDTLRQGHENQRDVHLVRSKVARHVAVKAQDAQPVCANHAAKQLQDAHLHFERVPLVAAAQIFKERLGKCLRVVQ